MNIKNPMNMISFSSSLKIINMNNETNNKNNEWLDFQVRAYTKKELALMYFPNSLPRTAAKHLIAWIQRCTPLWNKLQKAGYQKMSKSFTPNQVKDIVYYLGEP